MEVVVWYLAARSGRVSRRWYVHLTDFSSGSLIAPLYAVLLGGHDTTPPVFDSSVSRDPRLDDSRQWDGTDLREVKRVNPELVRSLASLEPARAAAFAAAWYESAPVRDFYHTWSDADALREVRRVVAELPPLAREARKRGKDVLQDFWWATS